MLKAAGVYLWQTAAGPLAALTIAIVAGFVLLSYGPGAADGSEGGGSSHHDITALPLVKRPVGQVIAVEPDYVGARRNNASIAYCDRIGENATASWLRVQRKRNREEEFIDAALRTTYYHRACLPPPGDVIDDLRLERPEDLGTPLNVSEVRALSPVVKHVFIDAAGRLYLRVVRQVRDTGHVEPALVGLDTLTDELDRAVADLRQLYGALELRDWPCICPRYFGIVGSRLAFDYVATNVERPWRVLALVHDLTPALHSNCTYAYAIALAPFPGREHAALVDEDYTFACPSPAAKGSSHRASYALPAALADLTVAARVHSSLKLFVPALAKPRVPRIAAPADDDDGDEDDAGVAEEAEGEEETAPPVRTPQPLRNAYMTYIPLTSASGSGLVVHKAAHVSAAFARCAALCQALDADFTLS